MVPQLLLVKRLFIEAQAFVDRADPVSAGLSISLLQDAAELYVWTLIKERGISVKDGAGFVSHLEAVQKAGCAVPFSARLQELNRARVNFKHYGNLPAPAEARKHSGYVEDALREAMKEHFAVDFDELTLVDLVADPTTREHLRAAEAHIKANDSSSAAIELAKARYCAFGQLRQYMPSVDRNLRDADRLLQGVSGDHGIRVFSYLADYLDHLRESSLTAMLQLPPEDFALLQRGLPHATQSTSGAWQITLTRMTTETECQRALTCIVNLCIRLQARS
jgi:hypothetical protein